MKIIYTISIVFFLASCASTKSRRAMDDYMATEIGGKQFALIAQKSDPNCLIATIKSNNGYAEQPYDTWIKHLNKQKHRDELWTSTDFKGEDFRVLDEKTVWNALFVKENEGRQFDVYYLSDPFYIKEEEVVLFYLKVKMFPVSTTREDCVVIMKKKNGKWYAADKIHHNSYLE